MRGFLRLVGRDLRLAARQMGETATVLAFFVMAAILFPFGIGPEPNILARIAAGVVWVTALLSALLALDRLFQLDYEDGSLELLALSGMALEGVALAKALAHWLTTGLPIIVMAPMIALMLNFDPAGYPALIGGLAIGTPAVSLIGTIGAALTLGARRGGVLLSLLVLPLLVPVLIFGAAAADAAIAGLAVRPHLLLMGGILLVALAITPFAAAAAIRQALE